MNLKYKLAIEEFDISAFIEQYVSIIYVNDQEVRINVCPNCENNNYKLYVNVKKKVWICHVCSWGVGRNDIAILLAAIADCSILDIRLEILNQIIEVPKGNLEELLQPTDLKIFKEDKDLIELEYPGNNNFKSITGRNVLNYVLCRGLTNKDICEYKLIVAANINGHFGPFIVFPIVDKGKLVAYQGRRINKGEPKYVSKGNIGQWVWPYPIDKRFSKIYITEGPFDALGLLRLGYNAVCTFGKKLSMSQRLLLDKWNNEIVFVWDQDALLEIINTVPEISHIFSKISYVDLNHSSGRKIDPGDSLKSLKIGKWIRHRVSNAIDCSSNWFLEKQLLLS